MKICFKDVIFKNLFSFGNNENKIVFNKGINLLTSAEGQRSNGVGKSSALMSIPYCLFGKTSKKITQNDLINWKNEKNCFAELNIINDLNNLKIQRSLKPNFLDIYINDSILPKDSSVTITQQKLEEMLKWDLRIFNNLIYCSNSTISLIEASTADKRKFLENLFNIEFISIINEKTSKKITSINNRKNTLNSILSTYEEDLLELKNKLKNNQETINIDDYKNSFEKLKTEYEKHVKEVKIIPEKKVESYLKAMALLKIANDKLKIANKDIESTVNNLKSDLSYHKKRISENESNYCGDVKLKSYRLEMEQLECYDEKSIDNFKEEKTKLKDIELSLNTDIKNYEFIINEKKLELREIIHEFDEVVECPTCGEKTNRENILEYQNKKKKEILSIINENQDKLNKTGKEKIKISGNIQKVDSDIEYYRKNIKKKEEYENLILNNERYIRLIDEDKKEVESIKKTLQDVEKTLKTETINKVNNKIEKYNNLLTNNKEIVNKMEYLKKEIDLKEKLYYSKLNEIEQKEKTLNDINNDIKNKEEKIKELKKELRNLNTTFDYLSYIKEGCQDKKIKRWIINDSMPYINEQANYYLSSLGIQYYLEISGFLEIKIHGVGVSDVNIKSLSSGEMKSINLAIAFSLMDVSQTRNNTYVDLLILDEILDSAIDENGIEQLMELIKIRQQDLDLKILMTSHRKEIQDFNIDYLYEIEKVNGFSQIKMV